MARRRASTGKEPNAVFRFVNHPGTKGQPFLAPALASVRGEMPDILRREMAAVGSLDRDRLRAALNRGIRKMAFLVLRRAQRLAPVLTGKLKDSINMQQRDALTFTIGTNVVYARAVELGSKPHVIRPKTAKALAFYWAKIAKKKKKS